jgi:hypothetical protein
MQSVLGGRGDNMVSDVGFMGLETGDLRLNPRSKYKQLGVDFALLPDK